MNKLKKLKMFVIGLLTGILLVFGTTAFASGPQITATLADHFSIWIDGIKRVPENPVLIYQDRTYLPAAFIATEMGGTVRYDESTYSVRIETPEPQIVEKIVERIVEVPVQAEEGNNAEKNDDKSEENMDAEQAEQIEPIEPVQEEQITYSYLKMPVQLLVDDYIVTVTGTKKTDEQLRVHVTLENKGYDEIRLVHKQTNAIIDGTQYSLPKDFYLYDQKWFESLQKDDKIDGYFIFEGSNMTETKGLHLELYIETFHPTKILEPELIELNVNIDR